MSQPEREHRGETWQSMAVEITHHCPAAGLNILRSPTLMAFIKINTAKYKNGSTYEQKVAELHRQICGGSPTCPHCHKRVRTTPDQAEKLLGKIMGTATAESPTESRLVIDLGGNSKKTAQSH